jgi:hypothetical protein
VRYRVTNQVIDEPDDVLFTEISEPVQVGAGDATR